MKLSEATDYGIPDKFIKKLAAEGIEDLHPPQADVLRKNLLGEKNLVVSLPTASGKTLIAAFASIKKMQAKFCKTVYIVPLVALANEKYDYFQKLFENDYRVALSVGDFDSADPKLADYDFIVCTIEKLDSLLRHNVQWVNQIGQIIVDEVHLLNDSSRGPTLEVLLTRLMESVPSATVLALSATINNSKELAKWLNANILISDFRSTELHEGVFLDGNIEFFSNKKYSLGDGEAENSILSHTIEMGKQALFFVSTRKNAESLAERLSKTSYDEMDSKQKDSLAKLSDEILSVLESPTNQCKKLAACIRCGTAFHHAGLVSKQRRLIEDNFRLGLIKAITSTPTLALGVNLPAFRVVIRDAKRFYAGIGSAYIPVLEYKQMTGRAGRPTYDKFGESILIAKTKEEAIILTDRYIRGKPEDITSKLSLEPVLRMHTLSMVASGFVDSREKLNDFFSKTFYAFQYGNISQIENKLDSVLDDLLSWGFVENMGGKLKATTIGKRVSDLYLDPMTAHIFVNAITGATNKKVNDFSLVNVVSNTVEMRPQLTVNTSEFEELQEFVMKNASHFLSRIPDEWDLDFEDFFNSVKTSKLFDYWMQEATEDQIMTKYRVAPGELKSKLDIADWLLFSFSEIAILKDHSDLAKLARKLRVRLMYGIKEELLPLVRLKGIGRARSRKLFDSGYTSIEKLTEAPVERLSKLVGLSTANQIKKQLVKDFIPVKESSRTRQKTLRE